MSSTMRTICPYRAFPCTAIGGTASADRGSGPDATTRDTLWEGSVISATETISASCVQSAGKKRATERSVQSWSATVRSLEEAAQTKSGLKNALGQLIAADSRKSERGAQGSSGGSDVNRCGQGWTRLIALYFFERESGEREGWTDVTYGWKQLRDERRAEVFGQFFEDRH